MHVKAEFDPKFRKLHTIYFPLLFSRALMYCKQLPYFEPILIKTTDLKYYSLQWPLQHHSSQILLLCYHQALQASRVIQVSWHHRLTRQPDAFESTQFCRQICFRQVKCSLWEKCN